jgi:hypothetical protein
MSELNFNLKDGAGVQRFVTPIVTITSGGKMTVAKKEATLPLAYILKAIADCNYQNVTVCNAVATLGKVAEGMKADTSYTLYMPAKIEDRDSDDLSKWTPVLSVPQEDVAKAVKVIREADAIYSPLRDALNKAAERLIKVIEVAAIKEHDVSQPVYFSGATAKRGGGKKTITSLF